MKIYFHVRTLCGQTIDWTDSREQAFNSRLSSGCACHIYEINSATGAALRIA